MSVHRLTLESDSIGSQVVYPTWSGKVDHERVNEGVYFRAKPPSEFKFIKSEYTLIKNVPDCEVISIYLEEKCGVDWVERWRGSFTTYDVKFNEGECSAAVSAVSIDDYQCFLDNYKKDQVLSGETVIVRPFQGTYDAGYECCADCFDVEPTGPICAVPSGWCFDANYGASVGGLTCDPGFSQWQSCFHRIVGVGTPTTPPIYGSGWTYLSGSNWWRCPDPVVDLATPKFDNGKRFSEAIEYLVSMTGCGLLLKSWFFGINADHAAPPSNIAYTFATNKLQKLQLHQKSDIKRPFATNPAQSFVWKMSLAKLLADLEIMFNVFWRIDGTDLILEHISYFEAGAGLDLSNMNLTIEYEKSENGAPNSETFAFADDEIVGGFQWSAPFSGSPVEYGNCGEGVKENKLYYFSTEVAVIKESENAEAIADSGFVLISTVEEGGLYYILENNEPLGWVQLHDNLHRHNRYFLNGVMNGADETFLSVRKTRGFKEFTTKICCDDNFDPTDYITTAAGQLTVKKASIDYFAGKDANMVTIEANI